MSAPRVLFIGGNGIVSSASSRLAVEQGFDLTLLNRGRSSARPPIEGARSLLGDASDRASLSAALEGTTWDVVVNFQSFTPEQAQADVDLFEGRVGQFVYISSASAYARPSRLPFRESSPLRNTFSEYSSAKAASERVHLTAYVDRGFPVTIVRPSHTYDETLVPLHGGWTVIDRMRRGLPTVLPGDGTSLWVMTHQRDFAVGLVGLLGNPQAVGETFQITSDEALTWNEIGAILAEAAGAPFTPAHVTSEHIAAAIPEWAPALLGELRHSAWFDTSKVRAFVPDFNPVVPYWRGAREMVAWYDADDRRRVVDPELDAVLGRLAATAG
jgi:nucleoside-diphosphate-sugar epimerase